MPLSILNVGEPFDARITIRYPARSARRRAQTGSQAGGPRFRCSWCDLLRAETGSFLDKPPRRAEFSRGRARLGKIPVGSPHRCVRPLRHRVYGRLDMLYFSDPAAALRGLVERLKPRGSSPSGGPTPPLVRPRVRRRPPSHTTVGESVGWDAGRRARCGARPAAGSNLRNSFLDAGVPEPKIKILDQVGVHSRKIHVR